MLGSLPHTRERQTLCIDDEMYLRITPAYAGKTSPHTHQTVLGQDHPRIRGKDWFRYYYLATNEGSPPHTRERRTRKILRQECTRITPAYAGKTTCWKSDKRGNRDHPRIRGKDHCSRLVAFLDIGSPPHTRERLPA